MIVKTTTVLLAVAPIAVAALITAPASPALTCVAAEAPASAETLKFTSSAFVASTTTGAEVSFDRFAVTGSSGQSRAHPASWLIVTSARACL
ncbi:hypothetical protein Ato02nite_074910 [Paractinoplanes toevensis]|uniref:Secreted protein n=1 Tax=Paractinoplanes toevensis TaxID=571911 RepID=A0A919THW5_9ACTN|nr:hypothetical protein Ato02nite_074910 [Actinoplanes toevensis]